MPPKAKFSKEQIIETAFLMVREKGLEVLTARNLAAELKTSTAPIFTAFNGIEEVGNAVIDKAKSMYNRYLESGLKDKYPFKGAGIKYIQFAKDEPELFKMLFMSGKGKVEVSHFLPSGDENSPKVQAVLQSFWNIPEEKAKRIYNHLSVYAHGLAVLYAQGCCVFTMEDINNMLSEVFHALMKEEEK